MEPKAAHKQLESPFDSDVEDECKLNLLPQPYREGRRLRNASYCHLNFTFYLGLGSYILNFVLGGLFIYYYSQMGPSNPLFPQMVYSPANSAIEYEAKKFYTGFEGKHSSNIYEKPPSEEVDQAWRELYHFPGISRITKSTAMKLENTTYPFADDPGYYIVSLAVFHQLHCLNRLRQHFYSDYYRQIFPEDAWGENGHLGRKHLAHCIESLRQSITCSSDVTAIVWQWSDEKKKAVAMADVAHTCRNFEAIHTWGLENQAVTGFSAEVFIEDEVTSR